MAGDSRQVATRTSIDKGDFREASAHFAFIDELFPDAPPDLETVQVSYLENVFVGRGGEPYRSARSALSNRLKPR